MAKKIIKIELDARTAVKIAKKLEKGLDKVDRSTRRLNGGLNRVQQALLGFVSIRAGQKLLELSDQFKLLEARIKIFRKEGEKVSDIQERLLDIAKANGSQIGAIADAYTKFNNGLRETDLNSQQILDTLQATSDAFRIFGVSGAQAESAILQLSQGLQKGNLDGEEFKAVSENASILLDLFAKEAGVARGALKEFASQGNLTRDIIVNALLKNMEDLNKEAQKVPLTFGQIRANLLTSFGQALEKVEKRLGVFDKFGKALKFVAENIDLVAIGLLGIAVGLIPKLILAIKALDIAIKTTPWGLILAVATTVIALLITRWDKVKKFFIELWADIAFYAQKSFLNIRIFALESVNKVRQGITDLTGGLAKFLGFGTKNLGNGKAFEESAKRIAVLRKELALLEKQRERSQRKPSLSKSSKKVSGLITKATPLSDQFDPERFRQLRLKERAGDLQKLNAEFNAGKFRIDEYNQKLSDLNVKFSDLESTRDNILNGINSGVRTYANEVGNLTKNISNGIKNTLVGLENQLVNFITKGKFEFKAFADAIISDLARIVIRQTITSNLARGIGASLGGGAATSTGSFKGNVFQNGTLQKFANGGVFYGQRSLSLAGGRRGTMSEYGPEAIMPLKRDSNGRLGVQASGGTGGGNTVVNVINQTNGEVETNERTEGGSRVVDVMIKNAVKSGFSQGSFDKELRANFGINRAGVI